MKWIAGLTLVLALTVPAFAQKPQGAGGNASEVLPGSAAPAAPAAAPVASTKPCLIVTSAEGHRFRNAMIGGVLTGGIGLAAGAAFSGGRYEYRDSFNLMPSSVKVKYKGPELEKLQADGVHIVVVNKKDKSGEEVRNARASCQSSAAPSSVSPN